MTELVRSVAQRLVQDSTRVTAEETPLPSASAAFWTGLPTALKRSEKTPLLFAIDVCVFMGKERFCLRDFSCVSPRRNACGNHAVMKVNIIQ